MCKDARTKHDWVEIQKFYDAGHTWRETQKQFGLCAASITNAQRRGVFQSRDKKTSQALSRRLGRQNRKHSAETKKKISESRVKFLLANPDKVPYRLNHASKKSYPEIVFENALVAAGITGWVYNYQHGIYAYDFAWPDFKLDVEIDGGTHQQAKVKKIDARRDKFSADRGWTVIRFPASRVKTDVLSCINELKKWGGWGTIPQPTD